MKVQYQLVDVDKEVQDAIRNCYPELPRSEQDLLRFEIYLRSIGNSMELIMDSMRVSDSPFLKLPSRD